MSRDTARALVVHVPGDLRPVAGRESARRSSRCEANATRPHLWEKSPCQSGKFVGYPVTKAAIPSYGACRAGSGAFTAAGIDVRSQDERARRHPCPASRDA